MENSGYMDSIAADRSMLAYREDEEAMLEGKQLISLEADSDQQEQDIFVYITENFASFLKVLRLLKPPEQELLLSYFVLHKAQTLLAPIFKSTQTVCSFRIRMAVKTLACLMLFGGFPSEDQLREVLIDAKLEEVKLRDEDLSDDESCSLAMLVAEYAACRSFTKVADRHGVHRPEVRRSMSRAYKVLIESLNTKQQAVGAYIHWLVDKANPLGVGLTARQTAKEGGVVKFKDIEECGQFRIKINKDTVADICDAVFAPRGTL